MRPRRSRRRTGLTLSYICERVNTSSHIRDSAASSILVYDSNLRIAALYPANRSIGLLELFETRTAKNKPFKRRYRDGGVGIPEGRDGALSGRGPWRSVFQ